MPTKWEQEPDFKVRARATLWIEGSNTEIVLTPWAGALANLKSLDELVSLTQQKG